MSSIGSSALFAGPGKCFAFIDADNVATTFSEALKNRGFEKAHEKCFSLEHLLRQIPADRRYLFGAAAEGQEPYDWLVRLRSEQKFIYRQGKLTEKRGVLKQQGVDVMLAVEALRCAHSKIMESCIIFSDDGDLLPLVSALVDLGIHTSVYGFGNPSKSPVAQSFQDSCDNFVQIGDSIIAQTAIISGHPSKSGNCNKTIFEEFGTVNEFNDGKNCHAIINDDAGGIYIYNLPVSGLDDYHMGHYYYFPDREAALVKYKLTGNFFA